MTQIISTNSVMGILFSSTKIKPILVGSRAYDAHKPDSDYDYMFRRIVREEIIQQCQKLNLDYNENTTTGAIKFDFEGVVYNFIFLDEIDYGAWSDATEIMKIIAESLGCELLRKQLKFIRLGLFKRLVNKFGGNYIELPECKS